jgi:hypothetical protein
MGRAYEQLFIRRKWASELPRTAHTQFLPGRKTRDTPNEMTVERFVCWGKNVKSHVSHEIIGLQRTIKGGLTLELPHPAVAIDRREACSPAVPL